jgi:SAM-dependent methyltransferase
MPDCCCRTDYDALFDDGMARRNLESYLRDGPDKTTRQLLDAIRAEGVRDATLIDIGGGIGAIQLELLAAGASSAIDVDASHAYLVTAQSEAERQDLAARVAYRYGDFVELASEIPAADVVTLDRVICCYADMPRLVEASVSHARRLYGLVYPVDRWWIRAGARAGNVLLRLFRQSFRFHVHRTSAVDAIVRAHGLRPRAARRGLIWQMALYVRESTA